LLFFAIIIKTNNLMIPAICNHINKYTKPTHIHSQLTIFQERKSNNEK